MSDLTNEEQDKLNEFQVITAFPEEQHDKVVKMLRNNYWNLEVALSKYFDGHLEQEAAREPLIEQPQAPPVRQRPQQPQNLQDFLDMRMNHNGHHNMMLPQLPIVRPISNLWRKQVGLNRQIDHFGFQSMTQSPILFILLFIPRTLTFILSGFVYLFNYFFPPSPDMIPSTPSRDHFNPIEHYESLTQDKTTFEFYKGDFNDAFDQCKRESKFMLLILLGDNDLSNTFVKRILNNEAVSNLIKEEEIIVYMTHCAHPQGLEISRTMRTRAVPAAYLLGNVASGPSGISSMSVCARLSIKTLNAFVSKLNGEIERYKPELISKRVEMEELKFAREIREMQDRAYEESLIADRIKQEEKELEEKKQKEQNDKINWEKEQKKIFYASLLDKFEGLESLQKGQYTTIRFKLPTGDVITQRFSHSHSLHDLYAFIDLELHLKEIDDEDREQLEALKDLKTDEDYNHSFKFELNSPFPRYTVPVEQDKLVKDVTQLWPNGSVMLEFFTESDSEEESDEEEDEQEK
ncbi:CYFA0S01e02102g1_1 [Cyberlindnera fabianii]|uniref:CYFA0S01e02102g1_1 n=1 Tax=Cyberlindnera fabianii TaxID=36022 RepID=A0A061AG66_CYBFA|nr:CYFA0S01e02102g1_1 [Cyberlindnera fabianii]